jgi:hypothetical protein
MSTLPISSVASASVSASASLALPLSNIVIMDAARHICDEARVVLTSLRTGPPLVAREELASGLMEVRDRIQYNTDEWSTSSSRRVQSVASYVSFCMSSDT